MEAEQLGLQFLEVTGFNPCEGLRVIVGYWFRWIQWLKRCFNPCEGLRVIVGPQGFIGRYRLPGFNPCEGLRVIVGQRE